MAKFKEYKRPYRASLHRKKGGSTEVLWTKYYAKLESAIHKAPMSVMFLAEPGDVIEITSSNFGYQIATIKYKVGKARLPNMETSFYIV